LTNFFRSTLMTSPRIPDPDLPHTHPIAPPVRRRRGGQSGNQNARKSGLYAANANPLDLARLSANLPTGLADEIYTLRVFMNRVLQQTDVTAGPERSLSALRAVCHAAYVISRLVRDDQRLASAPPLATLNTLLGLPLGRVGSVDLFDLLLTHAASALPPVPPLPPDSA
jgi:hypothetical protein